MNNDFPYIEEGNPKFTQLPSDRIKFWLFSNPRNTMFYRNENKELRVSLLPQPPEF